jgi:hypothetical protein
MRNIQEHLSSFSLPRFSVDDYFPFSVSAIPHWCIIINKKKKTAKLICVCVFSFDKTSRAFAGLVYTRDWTARSIKGLFPHNFLYRYYKSAPVEMREQSKKSSSKLRERLSLSRVYTVNVGKESFENQSECHST